MDVASLAATLLSARSAATSSDVQVSVLKKAMDAQASAATSLVDKMALPLATDGRVGTCVNCYA